MSRYTVTFLPAAKRQFKKLPKEIQIQLERAIDKLAVDPLHDGVNKLADSDNTYRVRVGDYRIIYGVFKKELVVMIVKVKHRSGAYS
jgi:mRNA interferase RelE/StbE